MMHRASRKAEARYGDTGPQQRPQLEDSGEVHHTQHSLEGNNAGRSSLDIVFEKPRNSEHQNQLALSTQDKAKLPISYTVIVSLLFTSF